MNMSLSVSFRRFLEQRRSERFIKKSTLGLLMEKSRMGLTKSMQLYLLLIRDRSIKSVTLSTCQTEAQGTIPYTSVVLSITGQSDMK